MACPLGNPSVEGMNRCVRTRDALGFPITERRREPALFAALDVKGKNAFAQAFADADRRAKQDGKARETMLNHDKKANSLVRHESRAARPAAAGRPDRDSDRARADARNDERRASKAQERTALNPPMERADDCGEICRPEGKFIPLRTLSLADENATEAPTHDNSPAHENVSQLPDTGAQDDGTANTPAETPPSAAARAMPGPTPLPDATGAGTDANADAPLPPAADPLLKPESAPPPAPWPGTNKATDMEAGHGTETGEADVLVKPPAITRSSTGADTAGKADAALPDADRSSSAALSDRSDQNRQTAEAETEVGAPATRTQDPVGAASHDALPATWTQRQHETRGAELSTRTKPDASDQADPEMEQKPASPASGSNSMNNEAFSQANHDGMAADAKPAAATRLDTGATHPAAARAFSDMVGAEESTQGVTGRNNYTPTPESATIFPDTAARMEQLQSLVARFGHWVAGALSARGNVMNIHLSPASLGRLTLRCREERGRLSVEISAETREARNYVTQHEAEIRAVVQNSGYRIAHFDVHAQNDGGGRRPQYDPHQAGQDDISGRRARRAAQTAENDVMTFVPLESPSREPGRMWWVA
jgi:flagellar hook-length control protein FliK